MTTYSKLQKFNRFLKNEITGTVILGSDENNNLNVISLDPDGNLKFESDNVARNTVGFGDVVNPDGIKVKLGSLPASTNAYNVKTIVFTGSGLGELTVEVDGTPKMVTRNSYLEQTKMMVVGFRVSENQELDFFVRNTSISGQTNAYEVYVFYG